MRADVPSGVTPSIEQVRRRFESWRASPRRGRRIPEELWWAAASAAQRHGVHRTAQALGLNAQTLRQRVEQPASDEPTVSPAGPAFVEVRPPASWPTAGCVIEIEAASGTRMRIELPATAAPDAMTLARVLLGGEA